MSASEQLPLFPLPMMVLPGEVVALHVFEPRYREMVEHCRKEPKEAGDFVIQYEEGARRCTVGTAVTITRILKEHEDGRVDLLAEGCRRVEVGKPVQMNLYHSADVTPFLDLEADWDNDLATKVHALHRQMLVTVTGDEPSDFFYEAEGGMAFRVAACSGMTFRERLHVLKTTSENERLELVADHLESALPQMKESLEMARNIAGAYALRQVDDPTGE